MEPALLPPMFRENAQKKARLLRVRSKRISIFASVLLALFTLVWWVLNAEMGSSNANLSAGDRHFLQGSILHGLAEIELGQMAAEKGESAAIRSLGQRIAADRAKVHADLVALAKKKGVEIPTELNEKYRAKVDAMRQLSEFAFDKAYWESVENIRVKMSVSSAGL